MAKTSPHAVIEMQRFIDYFTGQHYDFVKEFGSPLQTGSRWAPQAIELGALYHEEPDPEAEPPIGPENMIDVRYVLSVIATTDERRRETSKIWLNSWQRIEAGPVLLQVPGELSTAEQLVRLGFNAKEMMRRWVEKQDRDAGSHHAKGRRLDQEFGSASKALAALPA